MEFFAEYFKKPWKRRTFLETAHALPLHGVGYTFCRTTRPQESFLLRYVKFTERPIKGRMRGQFLFNGKPALEDVATLHKSVGRWKGSPPSNMSHVVRPDFPEVKEQEQ
mmetsp:Transcript_76824/g.176276  ORF Transcript_76824/g.176276 Transcript_76824/m.176276 type:complete len:109 (+) Transcript_76824:138-464(+)